MSNLSPREANSRLGLRLFFVYTLFYVGFVLVCAFRPQLSELKIVAGLNLAVLWGFALIGLAFLMAMIYGLLCKTDSSSDSETQA